MSSTGSVIRQFPIHEARREFPALDNKERFIFFDNGAGAQAPRAVLEKVSDHLISRNVQRGGRYKRSQEVDAAIGHARESVAIFLNALDPNEVCFGMNATSFIRLVSLAIAESLDGRREIVVTDLDHEANVATWMALQRNGFKICWWRTRDDGRLYPEDLESLLSDKTRLVACTVASNAIGSIVDVAEVARLAHAVGAQLFLDAVHYAPHGLVDVQAFGCDFLVCSGYKVFAPHMGFLWGRKDALDALPTFREDFIPDTAPWKIEVGTYVYENVAGMDAAIGYLEQLGGKLHPGGPATRRERISSAMQAIREYEASLSVEMLRGLAAIRGVTVYGVRNPNDVHLRVPTVCFNVDNKIPAVVCQHLADAGIGARDGNLYTPRLMKCLGLSDESGAVRVSLVHYNTSEEISRFLDAIEKLQA
jgi:cysteine desulfurase family protein (TIGR01976 family)